MARLIKNGWPALRSLNLSSSRLGADGMEHLVNGLWPDLMHLDLSNNSLDEEAMFLMSDLADKWPNLETLDLRLVQNFYHLLLRLPSSPCSHRLHLFWTALPHVSLLACRMNQLNAGGMVHLIKPKFSKLQSLDLRYAKKIILVLVIGLLYMAYPNGCRHKHTCLPRLRPYPMRGHRFL